MNENPQLSAYPSLLRSTGLSLQEATILEMVRLLNVEPARLVSLATKYREIISWLACDGELDGYKALVGCMAKGLVQIVDRPILATLRQYTAGYRGPLHGYPPLGSISYTVRGAKLVLRARRDASEADPSRYRDSRKAEVWSSDTRARFYYRSLKAARLGIRDMPDDYVVVAGPKLIDPWCACWWERFKQGATLDVRYSGKQY